MLAGLLNNQAVVVQSGGAVGAGRRRTGNLMIPVNTVFNREVDLVLTSGAAGTGLAGSIGVALSKDGGAFATITPTITERGNGAYNLALTAAHNDTTGSHTLYVTAPGCAPQFIYDQVALPALDDVVEGTVTLRQSQRLQNAAAGGKVTGAGTANVKLRDLADTKDRINAVVDPDGNRSSVTRDVT